MSLEIIYSTIGRKKDKCKMDIFKIDCGMCDWTVMPPIFAAIASGNLEVDQIQMELHALDSEIVNEKPLKVFFEAADAAKMRMFHEERNQWGCEGYVHLEYAFVSESFLRVANSKVMACGT
jgi:hypothetical protein